MGDILMTWKQLTAKITDDYEKALHWLDLSVFTAYYATSRVKAL